MNVKVLKEQLTLLEKELKNISLINLGYKNGELDRDAVLRYMENLEYQMLKFEDTFRNYDEICSQSEYIIKALDMFDEAEESISLETKINVIQEGFFKLPELINNYVKVNSNRLSLVIAVWNEGRYLPELVEYHRIVGADHIYIYDNGSTDNTYEALKKYIDEGFVTYIYWRGRQQQMSQFEDAVSRFSSETEYMGFIDADEFILPVVGNNIPEIVDEILKLDEKAAGVALFWRWFGSSGINEDTGGLVIEDFKMRAEYNFGDTNLKIICNPRKIMAMVTMHVVNYMNGMYSITENGNAVYKAFTDESLEGECKRLQLNHYYVKSAEYWVKKALRPSAFSKSMARFKDEMWERFFAFDRNEVLDSGMDRFIPEVKQRLSR